MQNDARPPHQSALFVVGRAIETETVSEIRDPAKPSVVVGTSSCASALEVEAAIAAASGAFTEWAGCGIAQRADLMKHAVRGLDALRDATARLLTSEIGKPLSESLIDAKVFDLRWSLALALESEFDAESTLAPEHGIPNHTSIQRIPLGVVTIIVPFNWPLAIVAASLPYALLAGNTVIVKVPETAPLGISLYLSEVASRLPVGVLNVIHGDNAVVRPLLDDRRIAKVCFTGSVNGGKSVMRSAATNLTRLTLELGGNDPAIVLDDADLSATNLDRLVSAVFDSSGQICMNVKRIYVHESRIDELLEGLRARISTFTLGHGLDSTTTHGPLHRAEQAAYVEELIAEAESDGATVERFGVIPGGELGEGHFVRPTLIVTKNDRLRVVTEEQFGPVIPILTFTVVDDAIARANDTWAGLGASVWSADSDRAKSIAARLNVGYVWINDHGAPRLDLRAPFGGMKHSGFGREQGISALHEFTDSRVISHIEDAS